MENLPFESEGSRCAASLYLPKVTAARMPCVVMAHGFTGTRDQLASYAERFAAAGLATLTFDYRHFGESAGEPRQIVDLGKQLADWRAAILLARRLPGIDPERIALWGTSLSGGLVIRLAAEDPRLAAVVAQLPAIDKGLRRMSAERKMKRGRQGSSSTILRTLAAAARDWLRGLFHLSPYYIPVFGRPGEVAAFTSPESVDHLAFFSKIGPTWRNQFAPRFLFGTPRYRSGTAERIVAPLLVAIAEWDSEADPMFAAEIAGRAPRGELRRYPAEHFDVYQGELFERMVADEIQFLTRHLVSSRWMVENSTVDRQAPLLGHSSGTIRSGDPSSAGSTS